MKLSSFFIPLTLVAAASLGFANNIPNVSIPALPPSIPSANPIELIGELSASCQAGLISIVTNPEFFQCVPVGALLPVLTDPTFLPSIISDPIANGAKLLPVFDAICGVPKCSDDGVANALKTVEESCAKDLKNPLIQLALGVLTFYSPVRDIICFKDNKDEYCLVESITNVLTLPPPPPDFHLLGGLTDKLFVAEPKFICTPCNKAILNTAVNFLKKNPIAVKILETAFNIGDEELLLGKIFVFGKCGFEFLDGKVPNPSKIDPSKFTYQQADSDKSPATKNEMNLIVLGSLLASTIILN
uniref:E3 ubiquitin-protein ligase HUWE1 n=1 Tax=Anthurium amnicola TaxID=1678845 RepID=A0A1D1ZFQ9_9ARAE